MDNRSSRAEERGKVAESILEEIIIENFPNLGTELVIQVQEANIPSNYPNAKNAFLMQKHVTLKQ